MSQKTTQLSTLSTMVSNTWNMLAQKCEKREEELAGILPNAIHEESDVENDSASPIFDPFYGNRELQTLLEMFNFNYNKFEHLCNTPCQTFLAQKVILSWGKKADVEPKDLLFVVLCILKAATNWDWMGEILEKEGPILQRIFQAVDILSPLLYQHCVNHYYSKLTMAHLIKKVPNSNTFPVLFMPLMPSSSRGIALQEHRLKENSTLVANTNYTATKRKCLWPQQDKQSILCTINLAASLT